MASRLITKVPADYPPVARAAHIEGNVVIKAIIGTDGSVVQAQIISGHPMLSREALLSVSKWRYQPVLRDSSPVEVATAVTVEFKLSDQPQTIKTAGASSASVVDSQAASAETIQLTNGRTIHADSVTDAGEKIEYTIRRFNLQNFQVIGEVVIDEINVSRRRCIRATVIFRNVDWRSCPWGNNRTHRWESHPCR